MSRALLETLLGESREFLACPEPDLERWQRWGARREEIFAHLKEADFEADPEEGPGVARLIEEIFKEDLTLKTKLQEKIGSLGQEMAALSRMRRGLKDDTLSHPAALLDRFV